MKNITSILLTLLATSSVLLAQAPQGFPPRTTPFRPAGPAPQNNSAQDSSMQEMIPPGLIDFQGVDVSQVLEVYARLVGRTLLRASLPNATIVLKTETPLTKAEAIQALQAVLALNGITVINVGDKFVKVLATDQAGPSGEPFDESNPNQLPELGSMITRIVPLRYIKPSLMAPILQPFAHPNSIMPIDDNQLIILRDDPENIKRMLELIAQVDVVVPQEYISEVIPIKYAMADDIANVLSSLESAGGGTVPFGQTTTPSTAGSRNGIVGNTGTMMGGGGGFNGGSTPYGQTGVNQNNGFQPQGSQSTPGSSPFANRLQSILNRVQGGGAGGGGGMGTQPIQILGQTKIVADERSNSLLVYATPHDMQTITNIIAKLDVLLSQVLIEGVIVEVDLNKAWNYGVSVAQNPINANHGQIQTVGAVNNGTPFYSFIQNVTSNAWPGNLTSTPLSGLSYFGDIGPNWDVALNAAANDSSTHILQRASIMTSQATEADFFNGESVPYVTSTYAEGYGYGPSSSYSQLQVGVSLDVTPFINPDGLVVMDINQQINDISGYENITGVGNIPTTDNRTFTSEVAVKDRDTVILGGFTDTENDKSSSGVPILQDIPIIGALFKSPSSTKTRDELLVLIRPTVLRTPEAAALAEVNEEKRSPGIIAARRDEQEVVNEERKSEAADLKYEEKHGMLGTNGADSYEVR